MDIKSIKNFGGKNIEDKADELWDKVTLYIYDHPKTSAAIAAGIFAVGYQLGKTKGLMQFAESMGL